MVVADPTQNLRYALDFGAGPVTSIVGITQYQVWLINVTNDPIGFDDASNQRSVTQTRLTVADGYRTYAVGDGYLNPRVRQVDGEQLLISNGQITAQKLMLGPFVFPYTVNGFSGGIDPVKFQPAIGNTNSTEIYIQLRGPALSPKSNFFEVKKIVLLGMNNIAYRLELEATLQNPFIG